MDERNVQSENGKPETTRGQVLRPTHIRRADVIVNRDHLYVFGDNMEGRGLGGQAREMRGEPNAIGVPTKWRPGRADRDYFTDADLKDRDVWHAIHGAFQRIRAVLADGRTVVIPAAGLGTGLSELPTRAPKMHLMIEDAIVGLAEGVQP